MGPSWERLDDPSSDGWESEVFHEKAKHQLDELGRLIANPAEIDAERLAGLTAADFSCRPLVPAQPKTVFEDGSLRVDRARIEREATVGASFGGAALLADALRSLTAPFRDSTDLRCAFKVFRVDRSGQSSVTRQYMSLSGQSAAGFVEQHATWLIRWTLNDDGVPLLQTIDVEEFEQAAAKPTTTPLFSDCTESVLAHDARFAEQFHRGLNHWLERSQDHRYFPLLGASGIAVGDVNGDGLDDIYVCQEEGLPNRLFVQNPDGTASDVSADAGVDWLDATRSALFLDLDNDGDQDLVIAVIGSLVVFANDGYGKFELKCVLPVGDDAMSLSAVDYDNDGDLDLYVCVNYADDNPGEADVQSMAAASTGFVYHDANNGGRNSLYRNDGGWRFTDVTAEVGLDAHNRRYSLAAAWEDFDNDGDQDLYVANDYGRNSLYRNDTSQGAPTKFVNVAAEAGAEDSASGMSVSWGDYNRDGLMDLYVGNMFSSAGNRIAYQDAFKTDAPQEVRERLQRFARGNTLLENVGGNAFRDVSLAAAVSMGRWAWSSSFIDLNNNGWEDLIVSNGYITTPDTGDL